MREATHDYTSPEAVTPTGHCNPGAICARAEARALYVSSMRRAAAPTRITRGFVVSHDRSQVATFVAISTADLSTADALALARLYGEGV